MRRINYILLVCILLGESIVSYAYSEGLQTINSSSELMNAAEKTEEDGGEIRIKKDEFDEIVGQLQGMKALLENMKRDYDTRLGEMQEKIAALEKEKAVLEKTQLESVRADHELPLPGIENELTAAEVKTEPSKVSVTKEERPIPLQTDASTTSPLPSQATAGSALSPISATTPSQSASSETEKWSPVQPISLLSTGKGYMNISFDGLFAAGGSTAEDLDNIETGGHDPNQRGFTVQNLETVFDGAIDPYFKGQANIVFQIDKNGESFLEVEEAYLTSMSLPMNLQVKAGAFFTEFGRLNQTHPHTWDFADQPLVNGRFLGPDGMRNPGVRLSWLAPTDNYTELFFTVQDSQGETAFSFRNEDEKFGRNPIETHVKNMGDLLYVPRVVTSFDLTDEQTILLGASAAFGPNSTGTDEDTLIYGLDMFWKWKSKYASGGFPFVTWQTEVMGRRYEAGADVNDGLPDEVLDNWGAYSQLAWGFKKRWVAGFRGDYVDGEDYAVDPLVFERWRLSPNLTFYPSEFSKIRLQYNYDDILGDDSTEHSVFVQFEFLLGSHGAHKF